MEKNIIFIKNFKTECYIGVYPNEKERKQKIKVTVKLKIKRLKITDQLSSTVCYQKILNILEKINKFTHINLVETLAHKLADEFTEIKNIKKITIKISKCEVSNQETDVGFIFKKSIK